MLDAAVHAGHRTRACIRSWGRPHTAPSLCCIISPDCRQMQYMGSCVVQRTQVTHSISCLQASQKMANMLGAPQSAAAPSQQTTSTALSGMSPNQLFRILRDLRALIQENPDKGRSVLRQNLPLTKALFQAQILLGMVNPEQKTLGEVWAQSNGAAAAPAAAPAGHGAAQPNGMGDANAPAATAAPAVAAPMQQSGVAMPPPPPQAQVKKEPPPAANTVQADQRGVLLQRVAFVSTSRRFVAVICSVNSKLAAGPCTTHCALVAAAASEATLTCLCKPVRFSDTDVQSR